MLSNQFRGAACAAVFSTIATAALAGGVTVTEGWFRALPTSSPSGAYFNLTNATGSAVTLTGAASPACGMLMLHRTESAGGMSSMQDMTTVSVAPGATIHFAPGGYHLMCMGTTAALKPGATVPVTLQFAGGSSVTVPFAVRNAAGR
jgi:copper(I)-binding protein